MLRAISITEALPMVRNAIATFAVLLCTTALAATLASCTQETQNEIGRTVRNWTGTDGILEVYAGDKLVKRFMKIDKLTTGTGTKNGEARPYRYGYGVLDADLDGQPDPGAKQIYFEISDYSTSYVFYENPR
jgi:hypothetical protein